MTSSAPLPEHVAIIMDGNGRWARERGLPRIEGHRRGIESVKATVRAAADAGVRHLTLFAFSIENWKRPRDEVDGLMQMLERFLREQRGDLLKREIRFRAIGRIEGLAASVQDELRKTVEATAGFSKWNLTLALNYGSRTEVIDAVKAYAQAVLEGRESIEDCDWDHFSRYLYTSDLPDPDLIVRTSGETRLSNFLLLQGAYSEFFFSPVLWPEFREADFHEAIRYFAGRERRFGRTGEQLKRTVAEPILSR